MFDVTGVPNRGRSGFTSRTQVTRFGGSVLGRGRSVGQTFVRDAQRARRSGLDHVSIVVNFSDGAGDFAGLSAKSGCGSVQFRDLARPSSITTSVVDLINLIVPRHALPSWLLARNFHGLTLSGDSAGARLIASHLTTLTEVASELTEDEGNAAVEATFVIAERFLGHDRAVSPLHTDAVQRSIRRRAMHLFDSPSLPTSASVADVARMIGISRSGLYRAFEPMGGVVAYVRQRRLDRMYAALRAPACEARSIHALARDYGFASGAEMTSAFKKRFGFSPEDIKPSTFAGGAQPGMNMRGELDRAAHDIFIDWLRVGETV
ncbi:helix-turn-helix domain-containing protein [Sphingomonas sp. M1-B02]|uniref:helix-turn-helix domain-containing protein n=1 Tax=Sphingomonas sp. M1-B02 TaxID=3114300 RepID=UPI00223FAA70|nr:helix-turn-helix domain-containing protein [Sphingomonas sp. S6-11]UZK65882.1 helix-turn-helix domain-containing protein [Sphingomonas sp. S6-11]